MSAAARLSAEGETIIVRVPLSVRRRGGRKLMVASATPATPPPRRRVEEPILKALARAWRWKRLLETGAFASIGDLAAAEKIAHSYIRRVLRLTLLSPAIVEMILDGRQPRHLQLEVLHQLPSEWGLQENLLA